MTVPREAVIWAYRLILGREPESDAIIDGMLDVDTVAELGRAFFASQEYRSTMPIPFIGGHNHVRSIDVEVAASPDDMAEMLANIAKEWRNFGQTEPHWSVITQNKFRSENLAANIEAFYQSGKSHVEWMLTPLSRSGIKAEKFGKILDFGCGVGRLTLALAELADQAVGVDISPPHLRLARERAESNNISNVDFVSIDSLDDLDRFSGFDLVVSFIVLQHNPPPIMAAIVRKLLKTLAPGGSAIFQIPTYIAGQSFKVSDYLSSAKVSMEMNAVPQHVIFEIAEEADCRILEVRQDLFMGGDSGLSHTFAMQKRS